MWRAPSDVGAEALSRPYLITGDSTLDVMLEESRTKFSDPSPLIRPEALERLCDSWERITSIAHADKAKSIGQLLDLCAEESGFRALLEKEARELTSLITIFCAITRSARSP